MIKKRVVISLLAMLVILSGCSTGNATSLENEDEWTDNDANYSAEEDELLDESEADSDIEENILFRDDEVGEVKIYLDEEDYADMLANPLEEEWKQGDIVINGVEFNDIAVRTKGNSSLMDVADNEDSDRYSLKVDFDKYVDGQYVDGIERINLNNNLYDPSYLRDYLSYYIADEIGLATPDVTFVNVYINDELIGLFPCIEQVDEQFIEKNFTYTEGDLYQPEEESYAWIDDNFESYPGFELETDEDTQDTDMLVAMLNELNSGDDYESVLDVDSVLKYAALVTTTVSMDSYIGKYQHNYYLYQNDDVYTMIPWDYNMGFGTFGNKDATYSISDIVNDSSNVLTYQLLQVDEYRERYYQYVEDIITGPMAYDNISAVIEEVSDLINPYVENDPTSFYGYEAFLNAWTEDYSFQENQQAPNGNQQGPNEGQQGLNPDPQGLNPDQQGQPGPNGNQQGPNGGMQTQAGESGAQIAYGLLTFIDDRINSIVQQLESIDG